MKVNVMALLINVRCLLVTRLFISDVGVGKEGLLQADGVTPALGLAWAHCVNTR